MTETTERILELMEAHGDTAYALEKNTELPTSTVVAWKKGKFKPSADTVVKVAKYYNVSTDYLFCLTDDPTPPKTDIAEQQNAFIFSTLGTLASEKRFLNIAKMYKSLPDEKREKVYSYIVSVVTGIDLI